MLLSLGPCSLSLSSLRDMLLLAASALAFSTPPPLASQWALSTAAALSRAPAPAMEQGVASLPPTAAQKTWFPKAADMAIDGKTWYIVDAEGLRLGRMASECAKILLGKHKPEFTPGADMGDMVIIVNAEKIIVTGNKGQDKLYRRHSGRPGGMKVESFAELQVRLARRRSARLPPAPGPEQMLRVCAQRKWAARGPARRRRRRARVCAPAGVCPGAHSRAHRREGDRRHAAQEFARP